MLTLKFWTSLLKGNCRLSSKAILKAGTASAIIANPANLLESGLRGLPGAGGDVLTRKILLGYPTRIADAGHLDARPQPIPGAPGNQNLSARAVGNASARRIPDIRRERDDSAEARGTGPRLARLGGCGETRCGRHDQRGCKAYRSLAHSSSPPMTGERHGRPGHGFPVIAWLSRAHLKGEVKDAQFACGRPHAE